MFQVLRRLFERASPVHQVGNVHSLRHNPSLSTGQYEYGVALTNQVQALYDGAGEYIQSHGLDRALAFPGNEWADIVRTEGLKLSTTYNDLNYLRLNSPFAGYHLPILDRLDQPRFDTEGMRNFVMKLGRGIPDDVVEQFEALIDPAERLKPIVEEYLKYTRNVPRRFIVQTPRLFGEMGIEVNGALASPDVILCQSRVNALLCTGVLDRLDNALARRGRVRIVEIGPGYGALAQALRGIYGDKLEYVGIDLPSSLCHSAVYLGLLTGREGTYVLSPGDRVSLNFKLLFVANYMVDEIAESLAPVDLAINTMSFCEMTERQVRHYGELFEKWVGKEGLVFEENGTPRSHHVDSKKILSSIFPHRKQALSKRVATMSWCQDIWSLAE
jgi:hypothetical protein